jgi:ribosomal protein S21
MLSTKLTASSGVRVTPFGGSSFSARRSARPAGSLSQPSWVTKGSYLVEVEVGEVEPEDVAIQRFQRAVTQTLVINELRRRRRVMTKIEALQAKQNEKGLIKKLNIDPQSWKEAYGESMDPAPFADYFVGDNDYSEIANNTSPLDDSEFFFDAQDNMYSNGQSGYMGTSPQYGGAYAQFPAGQYGQYSQYGAYGQDPAYGYQQQGQAGYGGQGEYADYGQQQQGYAQPQEGYTYSPQQTEYSADYTQQQPPASGSQPSGY